MNEVTKIHLGRLAFTISVDAHHELKSYLDAINKQVGDKEVTEEIEMRMAELLSERGISTNKVILPGDVDFLKAQLGNPKDFKEDDEPSEDSPKQNESKRLFRDTDNALLAGVASGLAQYFGVDVLLIRILFVIAVLATAGWGVLLYIILWLLVPEAKTSSERLQMAGKPVNVNSLKEIVERADVKGVAHRANSTFAGPINTVFRLILKIVGIVFIVAGLSTIFGLISAETYFLVNRANWSKVNFFPIGIREYVLLDIALVIAALIGVFIVIFGIAIFRRKWPIRTWVTGVLVGIILIGLAVGGSLLGNVYPNIRDRYNANVHTTLRKVSAFDTATVNGDEENINFQTANSYYVGLNYYGHPDLNKVKTTVENKNLVVDTTQLSLERNCQTLCIPNSYNLVITIYSPNADQLSNEFYNSGSDSTVVPSPAVPGYKPYQGN